MEVGGHPWEHTFRIGELAMDNDLKLFEALEVLYAGLEIDWDTLHDASLAINECFSEKLDKETLGNVVSCYGASKGL